MSTTRPSSYKKLLIYIGIVALVLFLFNDFLMPWYVKHGGEVIVPSVSGMRLEVAQHVLDSIGLVTKLGDKRNDKNFPEGTVINQNPISGRMVNKGRRVYLTVSSGEQLVIVPTLKGRTLRDAKFQLERQELKLGSVEYQTSDEFPENTVIEQKVSPGISVHKDVYVSVIVSRGKTTDKVVVPNLIGKNFSQLRQLLASRGLKLGTVTYQHIANLLPNTIVDQFPRAGEMVSSETEINVFVVRAGDNKREVLEN